LADAECASFPKLTTPRADVPADLARFTNGSTFAAGLDPVAEAPAAGSCSGVVVDGLAELLAFEMNGVGRP
jgi:hypothetical protein